VHAPSQGGHPQAEPAGHPSRCRNHALMVWPASGPNPPWRLIQLSEVGQLRGIDQLAAGELKPRRQDAGPQGAILGTGLGQEECCSRAARGRTVPGRRDAHHSQHKNCCGWVRGRGVASHRSPGGLPHANPGAEPDHARAGSVEGCPRAGVWSGCARSTGCHTAPAHKIESWGRRRAVGRREAVRNLEK
jgi:hypothetical protein